MQIYLDHSHSASSMISTDRLKSDSIFFYLLGVVLIDCLEKVKTINREYIKALLKQLNEDNKGKYLHLAKKNVLSHQYNAPAHTLQF